MKSDTVVRRIFFCVFLFWSFSLFSSFAMATENISEVIQDLEAKRSQEKTRAEFLGTKINDDGEYDISVEEELTKIEERVQQYSLRISELQEEKAKEQTVSTPPEKTTSSTASSNEPSEQKDSGGLGGWWIVIGIIILVIGGSIIGNSNSSSSGRSGSSANVPSGVFNQRFDTMHENISVSQAEQENLQAIVNRGVNRLNDPNWRRSRAAQNGEVPPELF